MVTSSVCGRALASLLRLSAGAVFGNNASSDCSAWKEFSSLIMSTRELPSWEGGGQLVRWRSSSLMRTNGSLCRDVLFRQRWSQLASRQDTSARTQSTLATLTPWCPLLPYGYSYKASCAGSFVVFDIQALWRSALMSKITNDDLTWSGTGCFTATPVWLIDWLNMVQRLHQHNIGYTADGFYRSDDPTNSIKALKDGG